MKPTFCCLLIPILLLQLKMVGSHQCSLDSLLDQQIRKTLKEMDWSPYPEQKIECTSVTSGGKEATCYEGSVVTGCACGYGCGSWDIKNGNTCHCQCNTVDWTTARCCELL